MPSHLRLGCVAPDFEAQTTQGYIKFHEWSANAWTVLFSHPDDFTPVCTTELAEVARRASDFAKRGVKILGLSANDVSSHNRWAHDIQSIAQAPVTFPIIGDSDRSVATLYDMLDALDPTNVDAHGAPFTVRDVFVIDPQHIIRLKISYPASTGRHFDEILRVIDALQLSDRHAVTTPANWRPGDRVIIHPRVSDSEAHSLFPDHENITPYLRMTRDPTSS